MRAALPDVEFGALTVLLPMHLALDEGGAILSAGLTLRKLIGTAEHFEDAFTITGNDADPEQCPVDLTHLRRGQRVFLRLNRQPDTVLRGHGVGLSNRMCLLNLGFGVGLADAVGSFGLTDADFAPSELAMELLFLFEANRAAMGELARVNMRLESARRVAQAHAMADPLTGLLNRRGMELALEQVSNQGSKVPYVVAQIDLDGFKQINDRLGHAFGDQILQAVAEALRRETRAGDSVARFGGDEFVILFPLPPATHELGQLGRRLIDGIEKMTAASPYHARISASIGFSDSRNYAQPGVAGMLEDADRALYRAKRSGKARASVWRPDMDSEP